MFTDRLADNAYTEFSSVKYNNSLIAFNRKGKPRKVNRVVKGGMKAVQFIERALKIRLYRGRKYKNNWRRGSNKIELYRKEQPHNKIFVSSKKWREFKRWLKRSKTIDAAKEESVTTTSVPRVSTAEQIKINSTASILKVL